MQILEKNNVILENINDKQQAIDTSPYVDYFNERAAIYQFDACDSIKTQAEAEWFAMNDTLAQFMEDTKIPLHSIIIPEFLKKLYETTGFNMQES